MIAAASRSRARARPLRIRLLLLAASGLVPLVMVLVWGLHHMVEERRSQAEATVLNLSRALATAVDLELRSVVALLQQMATSDDLEQADLRAFHSMARRTADRFGWHVVEVSDPQGRVLLRTNENFGTSDLTLIELQSAVRVIETQEPAVSRVIQSPQLRTNSFAVRIPVLRSGKLIYVVSAVLPTDNIRSVLTRQNIPSESVASVFDQTTRWVARSTPIKQSSPSPTLQAVLNRDEIQGVGRAMTAPGVESYVGYTRLPGSGWTVCVGTSVASANQPLYALLRAVALGLTASVGLAVFLAWMLSRRIAEPIDALKHAAAALGHGDPVRLPPLDIVELDQVAVALTEAAADRDRAATQIHEALHMAQEANRSKDQFLAMLGHELRNPLAPITNAVQLMALKGDDNTAEERTVIERQLGYMTRLVDDLLDVSRITSGRLDLRRQPVRLGLLLRQLIDGIRPALGEHLLSVQLCKQLDDAWVEGDEARLAQIFNNLLVNAIKFTPPGGSIRIGGAVAGREARVDIEDTGVGMSPQQLEQIFELFYQAPQGSDRARGGLGLGLAIVKSLVEKHGGSVHVASAGPGLGTRVTVRLPLREPPAPGDKRTTASAASGAGNVLVVDDNEDAANTCAGLLNASGYTARVAYTPEAAQQALQEFTADVTIMDIGLPGMSGYDLAERIKAPPIGYGGKLVALTGYGQATDMADSQRAGFDAHLTKPVAPSALLELVERLARSPRAKPVASSPADTRS